MPHRSGASHAAAALATVVVGGLLSDLVATLVGGAGLVDATVAAVQSPLGPLGSSAAAVTMHVAVIVVLAFVWGYAYHIRTFGREDDDWRRR
ncbi:hypothetical protein U3A55_08295 [Salarchaeum sp. III]|uniref:hypothetical protein n=1 Tax=Salarchaeum sp. III TaxID=3107927 RepID=UPI002EDB21D4